MLVFGKITAPYLLYPEAHGTGGKDKLRRLAGGRGGQSLGGLRTTPGEKVGIGCYNDRDVIRKWMLLMGGR